VPTHQLNFPTALTVIRREASCELGDMSLWTAHEEQAPGSKHLPWSTGINVVLRTLFLSLDRSIWVSVKSDYPTLGSAYFSLVANFLLNLKFHRQNTWAHLTLHLHRESNWLPSFQTLINILIVKNKNRMYCSVKIIKITEFRRSIFRVQATEMQCRRFLQGNNRQENIRQTPCSLIGD
jgi:hypothetical protein